VREEKGLKKILGPQQARTDSSTFENCWRSLLGREYDDLRTYCGGNASVMPGTATRVESDNSVNL
jgi:hypothetical protein